MAQTTAYVLADDHWLQAPVVFPGLLPGEFSSNPTLASDMGDLKVSEIDAIIKENELPLKKVQVDPPAEVEVPVLINQVAADEEAARQHAGGAPSVLQEQPPPPEDVEAAPHAEIAEETANAPAEGSG